MEYRGWLQILMDPGAKQSCLDLSEHVLPFSLFPCISLWLSSAESLSLFDQKKEGPRQEDHKSMILIMC